MVSNRVLGLVIGVLVAWLLAVRLRSPRERNVLFLVASYIFYGSFGLWFLGILLASTFLNYAWGLHLRHQPRASRLWLGIAINLLLLSSFKYLPGVAAHMVQTSRLAANLSQLVLPLGMSFWTFQALSYLLDIYQGQELDPSLLEFSLYMAFGPTVLSGPICRVSDLLPQFRQPFRPRWSSLCYGLERIWLGIFLMTLARALAAGIPAGQGIDGGFARPHLGAADVWALAVGYGFQLFFDFAGYTHIA
ncbi:MAG TPA: hypothetical protein VKT29_04345, partial [Terriglobales bacterium]|nr:hypothetical protein [Terriglobales bacterium]